MEGFRGLGSGPTWRGMLLLHLIWYYASSQAADGLSLLTCIAVQFSRETAEVSMESSDDVPKYCKVIERDWV